MSYRIVANIICFYAQNKLNTLNNIGVLLKGVLFDLRTRKFVHAKIFLRARSSPCAQFVEPCTFSKCDDFGQIEVIS